MTQEPTMTIHHALAELKLIDRQIEKLSSETTFVVANKHSSTKVHGVSVQEYKDDVSAKYDRLRALITRHRAIKRAILQSNCKTIISVCGEDMTVAEALYMKDTGIEYLRATRDRILHDRNLARAKAERENADLVDFRADQYVGTLFSKSDMKNIDSKEIEQIKNAFIASQTIELIDPINSTKSLEEFGSTLDNFYTELDAALSVSNATTTITVSY